MHSIGLMFISVHTDIIVVGAFFSPLHMVALEITKSIKNTSTLQHTLQHFSDSPRMCAVYIHTHSTIQLSFTNTKQICFADLCITYDSVHHGSLNICNIINVSTFKMEERSCAARILIKPLCEGYVFPAAPTTLPVTMTTKRNFPSHASPKCISTLTSPPPPPSPP